MMDKAVAADLAPSPATGTEAAAGCAAGATPPAAAASPPGVAVGEPARRAQRAQREDRKLEKRLVRLTGEAIGDYAMIGDGDLVMVCVSGGKDSYALLDLLLVLRERAPVRFDLVAVNLDQGQPGFPREVLPAYLASRGVRHRIETQDTYSIVKRLVPAGRTTCSLCSRLRRGVLYRVASELGASRIALGHHRDDILGTFFLNLFYGGRLKAMPPKLVSDDGRQVVIRPLAYVREDDLARYAQLRQFPIIPCDLCGSQPNLKRQQVRQMIAEWERRFPGRADNAFNALARITPSHLMDPALFDFRGLRAGGVPFPGGDTAFDEEEGCGYVAIAPPSQDTGRGAGESVPNGVRPRTPSPPPLSPLRGRGGWFDLVEGGE